MIGRQLKYWKVSLQLLPGGRYHPLPIIPRLCWSDNGTWNSLLLFINSESLCFFKDIFNFFLEGNKRRGRARNIDVRAKYQSAASCTSSTRDQARNPDTCPDWEPNQQLFSARDSTQPSKPPWPGTESLLLRTWIFFVFKAWIGNEIILNLGDNCVTLWLLGLGPLGVCKSKIGFLKLIY